MPEGVTVVEADDKTYHIVGTAHVSKKSAELVRDTINNVKPDVIAVELCKQRYEALAEEKKWDDTEITEVVKSGRTHLFLAQLILANFQRRIGDEIGVKPGAEMLDAINIAKEEGIEVGLVDRDIKVTLKRASSMMSGYEKAKVLVEFLGGVFETDEIDEELVEKLKEQDYLTELMDEFAKEIPSIKKVLVDERDAYIAGKLQDLDGENIVVVVGAGHVDGIVKILKSGKRIKLKELEATPSKKSRLKILGYIIPLIFVGIMVWGFARHGADVTLQMFFKWFLINGTLSALGVALALGHPLSVVAAFLAAPFTSLNPTIAAGWVAGLVELKMRKPRVRDFKGLLKLNSYRGYVTNRITRTLLVIVFANLGSSIGTFIALPYLASML